jgi:hypothetical protein
MSSFNVPIMRWFVMQCIKGEPTLRVGVKGDKPRPRLVHRFGRQEHGVREFLKFRLSARSLKALMLIILTIIFTEVNTLKITKNGNKVRRALGRFSFRRIPSSLPVETWL